MKMPTFRILNSSFWTLRQINNLSLHRWKRIYPCVPNLYYCHSAASAQVNLQDRQAVIVHTRQRLEDKRFTIKDSDPNSNKKRNLRAVFLCEQFNKLHLSYTDDKSSTNSIDFEQVFEMFKCIGSDPSQLSSKVVVDCVAAYVRLSLTVCTNEAEQNKCLTMEEYCKFETHLSSILNDLSLEKLVQLYNTFFECRQRKEQAVIFQACEKLLQDRMSSVQDPSDVVTLCKVADDNEYRVLWDSVENCILLYVDKMSLTEIMSCLRSIVNRASLNVNNINMKQLLLKLCSKTLEFEVPPLSLYHLTVVTSVMRKFSVVNEMLLKQLCDRILQMRPGKNIEVSKPHTKKVCNILNHISRFQYIDGKVFDMIVNQILDWKDLTPEDVQVSAKVLINAGNLNMSLQGGKKLLHKLMDAEKNMPTLNLYDQVQLLWACCVMGQEKNEVVAEKIKTLFQSELQSSFGDDKRAEDLMLMRKLRDIAMTTDIPLNSLPFLPKLQKMEQQRKMSQFENAISDSIEIGLPKGSYSKDVVSPAGHKIEIELYVDDSGKAVAKDEKREDLHRVAVKGRGYFTYSKPDNRPLGWVVMENQNLAKEGFKVLEIPHYDWMKIGKKTDKLSYLLEKIKDVIPSTQP
ncbi:FAST kinase domain-containing protein 4-like [Ylistrum balloti]|uniref:FAST kinase domain-containing protein 4-like n=1 Tax=Ylistrum balloti TaxID=509963 RepID=UPI002905A420|nr:FAST kinase domain-containing protein 4-like [Ylistrum balloti]XP_060071885.1 FAST kinase domain-containing protein 4-like [Ylistrum balloti]